MRGNFTQMGTESGEAPAVVQLQEGSLTSPLASLIEILRKRPPQLVITCARGSSAHAATFGKHLIEQYLGLPVSEAAPNIASIYHKTLALHGQLFVAVSQAGRSTDILEMATMAREAGAVTVAIVNDVDSPLAKACQIVLPMTAGPERSVAATKSFVASLAVFFRLVAEWVDNDMMWGSLRRLPARLAAANEVDWTPNLTDLATARSVITIGRGPTLAIAREAALKLKEACNLHAEAFSAAEFQHGPITLIEDSFPVVIFAPSDEATNGIDLLRSDLRRKGAAVFSTERLAGSGFLPTLKPDHPVSDAICLVQSFYQVLPKLARLRGSDVDSPRHLQKVTQTR